MCGKSGDNDLNNKSGAPDKSEKQNKEQKEEQKPAEYKIIQKEINDSSKKTYRISIAYPQIEGLNNASQESFNKYVSSLMNSQADTFRIDMKSWHTKSEFGSEFDITDTVVYKSGNIISVLFDGYSSFAGTAHPSHFIMSVNYDLSKNKPLTLSDLFTGKYLEIISNSSINQVIKQKKENSPDEIVDTDIVKEGAAPKEENFRIFNITSDTLFISFPEYQVASYAEGEFTAAIPYSSLKTVINPSGPLSEKSK